MSLSTPTFFQYNVLGPGVSKPECKEIEIILPSGRYFPTFDELANKITEVFKENFPSFEVSRVQYLDNKKERINVQRNIDVILMHRRIPHERIQLFINGLEQHNSFNRPAQTLSTQPPLIQPPNPRMPNLPPKRESRICYLPSARTPYVGGGQYQSKAFFFDRERPPLPPDRPRTFRGGPPSQARSRFFEYTSNWS